MNHQNGTGPKASHRRNSSQHAPSYEIPSCALISVEHPFIINDVGKAIDSLGGFASVQEVSDDIY